MFSKWLPTRFSICGVQARTSWVTRWVDRGLKTETPAFKAVFPFLFSGFCYVLLTSCVLTLHDHKTIRVNFKNTQTQECMNLCTLCFWNHVGWWACLYISQGDEKLGRSGCNPMQKISAKGENRGAQSREEDNSKGEKMEKGWGNNFS